ncbi:hypothetical protein FSOLCH5_006690 [Fusarium solani]|uniref:BTB domain-containing protein n=1 Tax=Fusarium solani TaxID=169388 RepID=A0A9P9GQW2_FUSSL|nr:uncharacterized protein B0J15DRAFT_501825 [Fusarium solani]KAH7243068.1 hypothetical protein B0J15DRAFT_501825 [Fusarium solani]KAJ3468215.1 hypothetical protein MRS44_002280 [Fusarium solani]KAJ4218521.1 hypothetical protein NW759_008415 [Fusarium solani]
MIEFDPRADITLKVGREKKLFSACSRALSRASPVFERMLYGHFTESKTRLAEGEEWVVELPEDDSAPMEVFLNISHSHFGRVPRRMPLDELYDLAVLSNYYDCTRLLEPWINGWMASIEVRDSSVSMAKALWVSWEFGRKEAFSRMALRMLMESDMGRTAEDEFDKLKMPPDIIERISAIRLQTIQALLGVLRDMVENLLVVDEKPRWCRHAEWMGPHRCESMILGSMTFCLARAGLWPLPSAEEVPDSIVSLHRKMTGLVIHDIGHVGGKPALDHQLCNPGPLLMGQIEEIFKDVASPVTKFHLERMDEQAKRLTES